MSEPQKYRPRPIEIEAMGPLTKDNRDEIAAWCNGRAEDAFLPGPGRGLTAGATIRTLDGTVHVPYGNVVIRNADGSITSCSADGFAATYEAVSE